MITCETENPVAGRSGQARLHMSTKTNESAFGSDLEPFQEEENPALSESGTHPVAVQPCYPVRPSYRPVARSADEATPPIPEDPATSRVRSALGDVLAVVHRCASRLRGRS